MLTPAADELQALRESWDQLGRTDPLWAILTEDDRKGGRWDRQQFLATGERELANWLAWFGQLRLRVRRRRALDFGCGAGRMTQALARHFREVVGVDVAPSMVQLAREMNGQPRIRFVQHDRPDLSPFPDEHFDLVYSVLVLQHIRPEFTERYLREFARVLAPGGVLAFQLPGERQVLPDELFSTRLELVEPPPASLRACQRATVRVRVTNTSPVAWSLKGVYTIGNHWWRGEQRLRWDDGRAWLPPLAPGEAAVVGLEVTAPAARGTVSLELDLVAEGFAWFSQKGAETIRATVVIDDDAVAETDQVAKPEARMEMHCVHPVEVEGILREAGLEMMGRRVSNTTTAWIDYWYAAQRPKQSRLRQHVRRLLPLFVRRALLVAMRLPVSSVRARRPA